MGLEFVGTQVSQEQIALEKKSKLEKEAEMTMVHFKPLRTKHQVLTKCVNDVTLSSSFARK